MSRVKKVQNVRTLGEIITALQRQCQKATKSSGNDGCTILGQIPQGTGDDDDKSLLPHPGEVLA